MAEHQTNAKTAKEGEAPEKQPRHLEVTEDGKERNDWNEDPR